ncbi:MAG: RecQ family ATP-dependent DNA helicase [Bacteroidetes bacterium]|nr:RecQ family ATP-dependent DNA helicase [Bacteroidota bacterium]
MQTTEILKKYWGYASFRPLQEDIIQSVLQGQDTLALLPTGGGKSVCYQVPAMAQEGLCIVVSPLIALMNDQVQQLQKKGIRAVAITSAMNFREIDLAFNNAIHNGYKFIYLSPERIQSQTFLRKLPHLHVNLIAVDEAHCISQWGYDFRPSYLGIKKIREIKPLVPMLAVTATATQHTVQDIGKQLELNEVRVFKTSFGRSNLHYHIKQDENKQQTLLNICNKIKGSGIIYVRNRKKTKEISDFLNAQQISSDFYHAGLEVGERAQKQSNWLHNHKRIMVSTNAFGMGIDKPDVRLVIHLDLPDSMEAWFQEAGRGGRDGQTAYALTLYNQTDIENLHEQLEQAFPSIEQIKQTYSALCNYYQIAVGSGEGLCLHFDINSLYEKYKIHPAVVYHSIKFLEKENYLSYSEALYQPSKLHILASKYDLYNFQVQNPKVDNLIKALLRSYGGLFQDYVIIQEAKIARALKEDVLSVKKTLKHLSKLELIDYIEQSGTPKITFTQARISNAFFFISKEHYETLKQQQQQRIKAVIDFVGNENICRSRQILQYFNEHTFEDCNTCDVCIKKKKNSARHTPAQISMQIQTLLKQKNYEITELIKLLYPLKEEDVLACINQLIDDHVLSINKEKILSIKKE